MRLLVVGDLHGQIPDITDPEVDAIAAPGDFCSDGLKHLIFAALSESLTKPHRERTDWYQLVSASEARELMERSVADGRKVLEHLDSLGLPVILVPGNWDWTPDSEAAWDLLRRDHFRDLTDGLENLVNVHHSSREILGYTFIGHGISTGPEIPQLETDTARFTEAEMNRLTNEYNEALRLLGTLFHSASGRPVILLSHNVPYDTELDLILNPQSPRHGLHFGSLVARHLVDEFQPLVCLAGHMHEHFGSCMVGRTLVVNSGFGGQVNVIVDLKEDRIERVRFVSQGRVVSELSH